VPANDTKQSLPNSLEVRQRAEDEAGGRQGRQSLSPLLALMPYILAHPRALAGMFAAIVISAGAMLVVPLGVRRMIDSGLSSTDGQFIDRYFAMMIVVGIVLAISSALRFYAVNWIGERFKRHGVLAVYPADPLAFASEVVTVVRTTKLF
jgi:ABC-type bacteriocin/lantibiotic exporter with double-glycine peptidase domain